MKLKKVISVVLAAVMFAGLGSACGPQKNEGDGKVSVKIGFWPRKDDWPEGYELHEKYLATMNENCLLYTSRCV